VVTGAKCNVPDNVNSCYSGHKRLQNVDTGLDRLLSMMTKPARRRSDKVVAMPSRDHATTSWQIDHGEIARRAYKIFCERGDQHGHDLD
jgi:hypothetical protein